ncbi:c-type cytochrome [Burkholderia plantarii]|uniref:c-type cytochrome n=1 Tax=Burkholderia plantarii TaxID=41899 RepID=UPI000AA434B2|nr:hypothetical protein [Burkholderia plantarii]GLZ18574.1 hypothetical protein Bpla01_21040 [Burkholderia plantarii]
MPYPFRATIPDSDIHAPYTDFMRGAAPRRMNAADPPGLVAVILRGAPPPSTAAAPPSLPMPDFAGRLNDDELAQLATFVRGSWTNHAAPVSAGQVAKPREARAGKPWPAARASPISPSPRTAAGRWPGFTRPLRRITRRAPGPSRPPSPTPPRNMPAASRAWAKSIEIPYRPEDSAVSLEPSFGLRRNPPT